MSTELDTLRSMLSTAKSDQTSLRHRLADLKKDFKADPWEDTAAQIKRTETRLWSGEIRIKALEYAVNVVASHEDAPDTDPVAGAWEGPRSAFPNSGLYMEYTEGGDHWGFNIKKSSPLNWEVFSMGEKVGHVELQPNEFPTFMSFDARGVLLNTHVEFNVAVKTVASISAGIRL